MLLHLLSRCLPMFPPCCQELASSPQCRWDQARQIGTTPQILESVTQVSNTCPTSFPVQCSGSTTFIVGENDDGNNSVDGASTPATQNQFYDNHTTTSASNLLVAGGKDSCSSSCQQTYWCGGQQIGPTFTITRSYTKGTVGPTAVTNIGVSKTP